MNIVVIDDERLARERIKSLLKKVASIDSYTLYESENAVKGLNIIKKNTIHLVLLDIKMPGMDGVTMCKKIAKFSTPPAVIFTTAYSEHALSAFSFPAIGYLLKPIQLKSLNEALISLKRQHSVHKEKDDDNNSYIHLNYSSDGLKQLLKIDINDVLLFYAKNKICWVVTKEAKYPSTLSLTDLEQQFLNKLIRIHRNCLVNIAYVKSISTASDGTHRMVVEFIPEPYIISRQQWGIVKEKFTND